MHLRVGLGFGEEVSSRLVEGGVEDLGGGAGFDEAALVEDVDGVGGLAGEAHGVGGDEHGEAVAGEVGEDGEDFGGHAGVEGACGFVEEDALGLHGEGAGDGDALLLAAGEGAGHGVEFVEEADAVEEGAGAGFGLLGGEFQDLDGGEGDVFEDAEVGEEVEALEDHAEIAADLAEGGGAGVGRGLGVKAEAVDGDEAGLEGIEAVQAAEEGGFAAAGGADNDGDLAAIDGEGEGPQDFEGAVTLRDLFSLNHGHLRLPPSFSGESKRVSDQREKKERGRLMAI